MEKHKIVATKELVEMYKKGKEAADSETKSTIDYIVGLACTGMIALSGFGAYRYFKGHHVAQGVCCAILSASLAGLSYISYLNACKNEEKAEGLEKEIEAELEKEVKI